MLKRLRENKSTQGTLLALPTMVWMTALLIIPLILTLIVSFGRRSPDGNVIYSLSFENYIRLFGYSTDCASGAGADAGKCEEGVVAGWDDAAVST